MTDDAAPFIPEDVPYAVRRESPGQTLRNRVRTTSALFGVGMTLSVLLGRGRR